MIHATEGFLFSYDRKRVVLVAKNRPTFCAGRFLGVGGKLEPGEEPLQAHRREFWEEADMLLDNWEHVATKDRGGSDVNPGGTHVIYTFRAFGDVDAVKTKTDEPILIFDIDKLPLHAMLPDTLYALFMCLDEPLMHGRSKIVLHPL